MILSDLDLNTLIIIATVIISVICKHFGIDKKVAKELVGILPLVKSNNTAIEELQTEIKLLKSTQKILLDSQRTSSMYRLDKLYNELEKQIEDDNISEKLVEIADVTCKQYIALGGNGIMKARATEINKKLFEKGAIT